MEQISYEKEKIIEQIKKLANELGNVIEDESFLIIKTEKELLEILNWLNTEKEKQSAEVYETDEYEDEEDLDDELER